MIKPRNCLAPGTFLFPERLAKRRQRTLVRPVRAIAFLEQLFPKAAVFKSARALGSGDSHGIQEPTAAQELPYPVQYESMKAARMRQTAGVSSAANISAALALLSGVVLRVWMLGKFFEVSGDSRLYGGMAKNLLLHGQYALSDQSGVVHPTLIRLPGYPLFLAACFRLFGMENYWAASIIQIVLELLGCLLLAAFASQICSPKYRLAAAQATLWLAALCPFTAVYDAEPLTEGLSLFCIALALWSVLRFLDRAGWFVALAFTFSVTYSALLRPDGALVGVALAPVVLIRILGDADRRPSLGFDSDRAEDNTEEARAVAVERQIPHRFRLLAVCLILALAPFAAWTWRNWHVFHVIEPLAPRYATDPSENPWPGWQRWMKTWCLDFVSTNQVYWNVPGEQFDLGALPSRAFDSPAQYSETARLAADYESNGEELSPDLDNGFARLAQERIAAHPLRYYVILPVGRVADMWFRPRVENLPIDLDWWVYRHHYAETRFSWFYAALNALYVALALGGLCLRPRLWPWMLAYMVLRSALLATIEAPEARYTLECFPMLFALGGIAVGRIYSGLARRRTA